MNMKMTVLAAACALVLSACGNNSAPTATPDVTPAPTATTSAQAEAPAATMAPPAASAATSTKSAAVVTNCSTEIEANDSIQYNVASIVVPKSCSNFKITLKHTGKMPITAMGHDVVITKQSDMQGVDTDAAAAGAADSYLKPNDPRVIAHTKLIGGGETTSVSFSVSKIESGGPYVFFCSFPGHSALMHGPISVE